MAITIKPKIPTQAPNFIVIDAEGANGAIRARKSFQIKWIQEKNLIPITTITKKMTRKERIRLIISLNIYSLHLPENLFINNIFFKLQNISL